MTLLDLFYESIDRNPDDDLVSLINDLSNLELVEHLSDALEERLNQ